MDQKQTIDDLVNTIDQFMAKGGGHMNVTVDGDSQVRVKSVETTNSVVCQGNNMACCTPTLHEGLDRDE
ncbi:MAG TPA: hypothetical protein IAB39_02480 [Candidatus Onthovicinus excrementipullorum]|nr:hypothetical protein [Candidatus Onthovicinus excrementipullorum]